jgi:hypothetical protein
MEIPETLREAFLPSDRLILDVARRQIDDEMLREIAAADYGIELADHLAALRPIRDDGVVPLPLKWHPGEVLKLTSWCDPDNPDRPPFKPGPSGQRGHLIRTFACAALLLDEPSEATIVQCLVSTKRLEKEFTRAAAGFLTWQIPRMQADLSEDRWLWAFGLLVLATRSNCLVDQALEDAATWFLAEESEARAASDALNPAPGPFGVMQGFWKPMIIELNDNLATIKESAGRRDLEFISEMLRDEF